MRSISSWIRAAACGAFLLSLNAVAASSDPVVLAYEPDAYDVAPVNSPSACVINIIGISDQRPNKESIGTEFRIIRAGEAVSWLYSALDNLKAYGFTVQRSDGPAADAINIDLKLTRAYTWHGDMRINGAVAVEMGITPVGGKQSMKKFRASGSKTNMWGANSEYVTALNYALNGMLNKVAANLQQACVTKVAAVN